MGYFRYLHLIEDCRLKIQSSIDNLQFLQPPASQILKHPVIGHIAFDRSYRNKILAQRSSINGWVVFKRLHIWSLPVIGSITRIYALFNIFGQQSRALPTDPNSGDLAHRPVGYIHIEKGSERQPFYCHDITQLKNKSSIS